MRKKKSRSKKLDVFKQMPPLYHTLPDDDFSMQKSEVVNWMKEQDVLMEWLLRHAQSIGYIKYNPENCTWRGIDWEPPRPFCPHCKNEWSECSE